LRLCGRGRLGDVGRASREASSRDGDARQNRDPT
jgi:hypothetical protein